MCVGPANLDGTVVDGQHVEGRFGRPLEGAHKIAGVAVRSDGRVLDDRRRRCGRAGRRAHDARGVGQYGRASQPRWRAFRAVVEPVHRCDRGSVRRRPAAVRGRLDARGTNQHTAGTGRSSDRGDGGALRRVGRGVGRCAPRQARRGGRAGGRLRGRIGVLPRTQLPHRRRLGQTGHS